VSTETGTFDAGAPQNLGTGGAAGIGGATSLGGTVGTGGITSSGGTTGKGGTTSTGGTMNSGGTTNIGTGGTTTPVTASTANCGIPTAVTGSFIVSNAYYKVGSYAGYGYVYIAPTSTMSIQCPNTSLGSSTSALCGAGTVPADSSYAACAGFGFNLAQPTSGANPSPAVTTTVSQVVVTFINTANTDLHIQIARYSGGATTHYCYAAKGKNSPLTLKASDFTTTCWDSANPGTSWDGAAAQNLEFIIPSSLLATPFDACIENVTFS
jgi:hypothetical protein